MSSIVQRPRARAEPGQVGDRDCLGEADDPVVARVDPEQGGGLGADRALVIGRAGSCWSCRPRGAGPPRPRRSRAGGSCRRSRRAGRARRSPRGRRPGPAGPGSSPPALLLTTVAASAPVSAAEQLGDARGPPARARRRRGRTPGCSSPATTAATASTASAASGARPSPVWSKMPVALRTGRGARPDRRPSRRGGDPAEGSRRQRRDPRPGRSRRGPRRARAGPPDGGLPVATIRLGDPVQVRVGSIDAPRGRVSLLPGWKVD